LEREGQLPLPPYIERPDGNTAEDRDNYQTMFAEEPGAVAAPTASLHFTSELLSRLEERGVQTAEVVLHVGPGTFLPVRPECSEDVREHQMHGERYSVSEESLGRIKQTRKEGGRVVAVGTTAVRALETVARTGELAGESTLFIYPGFEFRLVDAMVTNFHLPRSTLLMLVSAFAGRESVLSAYEDAVERHYRFFSYGDAMLISQRRSVG
jgi:S-adenosylmethionine:tRNA ribosyltransferase-isomerase